VQDLLPACVATYDGGYYFTYVDNTINSSS
jgi:hypothetical protein